MAITRVGVNLIANGSARTIANWNNVNSPGTTGVRVADCIDIDSGSATGYTLTQNGAFAGALDGGQASGTPDARFPIEFFNSLFYVGIADDDVASFTHGNLPVGASYTVEAAGCGGNASRDTTFSATDSTPVSALYDALAGAEVATQPVVLQGTVPANGQITISGIGSSVFAYNNGWILTVDTGGAGSATISNLDTDNSVTTYQQTNANGVSGFGGPITSGTLGGEVVTIIDGDWQSNGGVVSLRVPGNLATGTFDLVLSDGTDSATLSGVTFTQTHPYEAPYGLVDSNSAWREQRLTPGTRWRVTREFQYITYNYAASQAETPPDGNDLNDHAEADPGYTGADYQDREVLYSDGTTATYRVNVTVGEGGNITTRRSLRRKLRRALRILLRREL
jgi:hypothetical protein